MEVALAVAEAEEAVSAVVFVDKVGRALPRLFQDLSQCIRVVAAYGLSQWRRVAVTHDTGTLGIETKRVRTRHNWSDYMLHGCIVRENAVSTRTQFPLQ